MRKTRNIERKKLQAPAATGRPIAKNLRTSSYVVATGCPGPITTPCWRGKAASARCAARSRSPAFGCRSIIVIRPARCAACFASIATACSAWATTTRGACRPGLRIWRRPKAAPDRVSRSPHARNEMPGDRAIEGNPDFASLIRATGGLRARDAARGSYRWQLLAFVSQRLVHPLNLPLGEHVHGLVVHVIEKVHEHVAVGIVGAGDVGKGRLAEVGSSLGRRVRDQIAAGTIVCIPPNVPKAQVVTDRVGRPASLVERRRGGANCAD